MVRPASTIDKGIAPVHSLRPVGLDGAGSGLTRGRNKQGQGMRIQVSGKQIDIGDALRTHVEDRLLDAVGKYFDRPVEAIVTFSRDRHEFISDSSVHLPTGMTV